MTPLVFRAHLLSASLQAGGYAALARLIDVPYHTLYAWIMGHRNAGKYAMAAVLVKLEVEGLDRMEVKEG